MHKHSHSRSKCAHVPNVLIESTQVLLSPFSLEGSEGTAVFVHCHIQGGGVAGPGSLVRVNDGLSKEMEMMAGLPFSAAADLATELIAHPDPISMTRLIYEPQLGAAASDGKQPIELRVIEERDEEATLAAAEVARRQKEKESDEDAELSAALHAANLVAKQSSQAARPRRPHRGGRGRVSGSGRARGGAAIAEDSDGGDDANEAALDDEVDENDVRPDEAALLDDNGIEIGPIDVHEWRAAGASEPPLPERDPTTGYATLPGQGRIGRISFVFNDSGGGMFSAYCKTHQCYKSCTMRKNPYESGGLKWLRAGLAHGVTKAEHIAMWENYVFSP